MRTFLQEAIEESGITIHTKTSIDSIRKQDDGGEGKLVMSTNHGDFPVDEVMFATGRKPNVKGLNLDTVGKICYSAYAISTNTQKGGKGGGGGGGEGEWGADGDKNNKSNE